MARIAVVGGGIAGVAASMEAARRGAAVTLFESSDSLMAPKSSWPSLLDAAGSPPAAYEVEHLTGLGVVVRLGETVRSVDQNREIITLREKTRFDSVVLGTGSRPVDVASLGRRKKSVHVLDGMPAYVSLSSALPEYQSVAVGGGGPLALMVAEKLLRRGIKVMIFAKVGLMTSQLNESVRGDLRGAAVGAGATVIDAQPETLAGVDSVEAVVAAGDVYPCQAFIFAPSYSPNVPSTKVGLGRGGGVLVDSGMRSGWAALYAAGDCAETAVGSTTKQFTLESSARVTGEVAGINASGGKASAKVSWGFFAEFFGLGVATAGLSLKEALLAGFEVSEAVAHSRDDLVCSLSYDRGSLRVVGIQMVGKGIRRYVEALPALVASGMGIDEIAFQDRPGSIDISPIAEAAREGLRSRC